MLSYRKKDCKGCVGLNITWWNVSQLIRLITRLGIKNILWERMRVWESKDVDGLTSLWKTVWGNQQFQSKVSEDKIQRIWGFHVQPILKISEPTASLQKDKTEN